MDPSCPLTRSLAVVCALCPLCFFRRRFPQSAYARFMGRVERNCPFCKAYDCVHRARDAAARADAPKE